MLIWPAKIRTYCGGMTVAEVTCFVSDGLRSVEATVAVEDINGHQQCLRVERDFLTRQGKKWFLPIGVVYEDPYSDRVLIELPHEADSGANRLWVRRESLLWPSSLACPSIRPPL